MKKYMQLFLNMGHYWKSVFSIAFGNAGAQLMIVISVPVLARLYSPADFGMFAVFGSLSTIIAVLATGRYEAAIPLPDDPGDSWRLYLISLILGIGSACFMGITIFGGLNSVLTMVLPDQTFTSITLFLPLGVMVLVGVNASEYWLNRNGDSRWIGASRFVAAVIMVGCQYLFAEGSNHASGLIIGFIAGNGACFFSHFIRGIRYRKAGKSSCQSLILMYRRFPQYLLLAQLLNSLSSHLPVLLLGSWFGTAVAGYYAMANRGLNVFDIFSTATGQVFYPMASRQCQETGECYETFSRTIKRLAHLSVLVFPLTFFLSPIAVELLLGADWNNTTPMIRVLIPLFWVRFIVSPITWVYYIRNRQELYLKRQVFLVIGIMLALFYGRVSAVPLESVLWLSLVTIGAYYFDFLACRKMSKAIS